MRELLSAIKRRLKMTVQHWIGTLFGPRQERFVILKKLPFQNAEAVELREKKSGSLADRPFRIVGMLGFPGGKIFLRASEIQVVQAGESMIQSGRDNYVGGRGCTGDV